MIAETDKTDAAPAQELRTSSDAMAREITEPSREVVRLAAEEELARKEIDSPQDKTTEDVLAWRPGRR